MDFRTESLASIITNYEALQETWSETREVASDTETKDLQAIIQTTIITKALDQTKIARYRPAIIFLYTLLTKTMKEKQRKGMI